MENKSRGVNFVALLGPHLRHCAQVRTLQSEGWERTRKGPAEEYQDSQDPKQHDEQRQFGVAVHLVWWREGWGGDIAYSYFRNYKNSTAKLLMTGIRTNISGKKSWLGRIRLNRGKTCLLRVVQASQRGFQTSVLGSSQDSARWRYSYPDLMLAVTSLWIKVGLGDHQRSSLINQL